MSGLSSRFHDEELSWVAVVHGDKAPICGIRPTGLEALRRRRSDESDPPRDCSGVRTNPGVTTTRGAGGDLRVLVQDLRARLNSIGPPGLGPLGAWEFNRWPAQRRD